LVNWNIPSWEIIPNPHFPAPENDDLDFFI
jgi:hypothetical protein